MSGGEIPFPPMYGHEVLVGVIGREEVEEGGGEAGMARG